MLGSVTALEGEEDMKRRDFVAAAGGASLLPNLGSSEEVAQGSGSVGTAPQVLELRRYRLRFGPMETRFADYQKNVLVPALNRAGIKPVGAEILTNTTTLFLRPADYSQI